MFDSRVIANAVLERADERGRSITNLDLQKIVYFLHGHFMKLQGRPLINTEFEAWTFGPVNKPLYDAFKSFNDSPISERASAFDPVKRTRRELPALSDPDALSVIDAHIDYYLDMPTYLLVEFTHQPGTPWFRTVESADSKPNVGMKISNELIGRFFEGPSPEKG